MRALTVSATAACLCLLTAIGTTTPLHAQWTPPVVEALEPASSGGVPRLVRTLERINTHRRVLVIGAHPDDEDTSLLAHSALGEHGEAAYLSLSRGDGGQNLIGEQLGVGLGLIRSGELVAARSVDGARQFFTRAYDFGYSRSAEETFRFWPRDEVLRDAVWVVRRFKPHIIVAIFPPDERAGHGQHQVAGIIARDVFEAAAEPEGYPELTRAGYGPWQTSRFFRAGWFSRDPNKINIGLGEIEPVTGKTLGQVAMASRSMHRSQDMGVEQRLGARDTSVIWQAGGDTAPATPFADIPTSLAAIADSEGSETAATVRAHLNEASEHLTRALEDAYGLANPARRTTLNQSLRDALDSLRDARGSAKELVTHDFLNEKLHLLAEAILTSNNVVVDAWIDRETIVEGSTATATVEVYNQSDLDLVASAEFETAPGWTSAESQITPVLRGALESMTLAVGVVQGASPTRPYFLPERITAAGPSSPALYPWPDEPELWASPFEPAPLVAKVEISVAGGEFPIAVFREVVHRYRDQAIGEVRRPVRAVPRLEIGVSPDLLLWPQSDASPRAVEVSVKSWAEDPVRGTIVIEAPSGWQISESVELALDPGARQSLRLIVTPPSALSVGRHEFAVRARIDGDDATPSYGASYDVVDYPHIRPVVQPKSARFEASVANLTMPTSGPIGYFRGASDRVPEALRSIGMDILELDAQEILAGGDALDTMQTIIIGSRAYEVDPDLVELHGQLMRWVEDGGSLVVQYHKYPFARGQFFPFPLSITRPHGRVADETAPVTLVEPEHPVFQTPHRIGNADFDGWVQERGLYFASTWDERYVPLLELADPGRDAERGALLVADVGQGSWIYSGLAFFRQLPAGVPGATRLFLNLVNYRPAGDSPAPSGAQTSTARPGAPHGR